MSEREEFKIVLDGLRPLQSSVTCVIVSYLQHSIRVSASVHNHTQINWLHVHS